MVHVKPQYRYLFLAAFLLTFHYALTVYINSSYLLTYFSEQTVNNLYILGSLVTLVCLILSSRVIRYFGNYILVLFGIIAEAVAVLTLAFSTTPWLIVLAFIAHQALPVLLLFGMDIFFEGTLTEAHEAEKIRSYYLTFVNCAFVLAPLVVAFISKNNSFKGIYILSAILLSILWFVVLDVFRTITPKKHREIGFLSTLQKFLKRKKLFAIFLLNFFLQCFFTIMVIYTGPYLHEIIGLSWEAIGLIFTIMLLPFVIFEAPLGKIFARYHDERDVIIAGFVIMSGSTIAMAYAHVPSIFLWATLLFMTRVGASFVEAGSEAAFFKRMTDQDAGFIGIFRMTSPLSYVLAPLFITSFIPTIALSSLYGGLGIILLLGVGVAYKALS